MLRSPNRALGLGQVTAHNGWDARVHPSEQSTSGRGRKSAKLHKQRLRPHTEVLYLGGPGLYQPFQALSNILIFLGYRMVFAKTIWGFFGELSSAHYHGTMHRSQYETELHRIVHSSTMWSRKWHRQEGISYIKQRVLLRPACDSPVLKHFSSTSHWLGIQNPPLEIWETEEVKPILGTVQKPNKWIQDQPSAVKASSLVLPQSSLWTHHH
jgi:hypothetical protein